jgi:hypothetical protein
VARGLIAGGRVSARGLDASDVNTSTLVVLDSALLEGLVTCSGSVVAQGLSLLAGLTVSGASSLKGGLYVDGSTIIAGGLQCAGDLVVEGGQLFSSGSIYTNASLIVSGLSSVQELRVVRDIITNGITSSYFATNI